MASPSALKVIALVGARSILLLLGHCHHSRSYLLLLQLLVNLKVGLAFAGS